MSALKLYTSAKLDLYSALTDSVLKLPYIPGGINAGFPSPAMDFIQMSIDLNRHLIEHPSSTFYGRVKGHSMKDDGINDGDLLIIDKSLEPVDGKVAVCYIDGEFTLKRIRLKDNECWLIPANENYKPIKVLPEDDFIVWGIVTHVIKAF